MIFLLPPGIKGLRQIEWRLQNGPITKSGVLQVTALFFGKFVSLSEPLKKS